jgi:small subunit ribosomal protein S2
MEEKGYMREITLEELLEAGCHFGHQINRRNPKADEFIYEARSNVHIINLEATRNGLLKAAEFVKNLSAKGGTMVVVGTKRQAQAVVKTEVERARAEGAEGLFYVISRWVGGTLTNVEEVSKNYKKLKDLRSFLEKGDVNHEYTKKEMLLFEREKEKLEGFYEGIVDMEKNPDALFIIDVHLEQTAVKETVMTGVATVGIVDTNSDPLDVDYPIPANDDAVGSIQAITTYIIDAWIEGKKSPVTEEKKQEEKPVEKKAIKEEKKEEKKTEKKTKEVKTAKKAEKKTAAKPTTEKKEKKKIVTKEKGNSEEK